MADPHLSYIFNHVFLPSQTPQADDREDGKGDVAIIFSVLEAAKVFAHEVCPCDEVLWSSVGRCLNTFATLHTKRKVLATGALAQAFQRTEEGDTTIVHINRQNSALLIFKDRLQGYIIEAFETQADTKSVISSGNSLVWHFPSKALRISSDIFDATVFRHELANLLARASVEDVKQFAARTSKAASSTVETRDSVTPALIGQMLMSIFRACGTKIDLPYTKKKVRDESNWNNAEQPWRRSPTWLVLRVAIQRFLCHAKHGLEALLHYKFFMCFFTSTLCRQFTQSNLMASDQLQFARVKLARRVDKLEQFLESVKEEDAALLQAFTAVFVNLKAHCQDSLDSVLEVLTERWTNIQLSTSKSIRPLPLQAPVTDFTLSLDHSGSSLRSILSASIQDTRAGAPAINKRKWRKGYNDGSFKDLKVKTWQLDDILSLHSYEAHVEKAVAAALSSDTNLVNMHDWQQYHAWLDSYQGLALSAYENDPLQLSKAILLLFEIWCALDQIVVTSHKLLSSYGIGFTAQVLSSIQAPTLADMERLHRVEQYLENRFARMNRNLPSIYGGNQTRSLAVEYFNTCANMQMHLSRLRELDQREIQMVEEELEETNNDYENLSNQALGLECTWDDDNAFSKHYHHRGCTKCSLHQRMAKLRKFKIREARLPSDDVKAKAMVFELQIPKDIAAWRDATWQLLCLLGVTSPKKQPAVNCVVRNHPSLADSDNSVACRITLASSAKSFFKAHYKKITLPASMSDVWKPHGPQYGLYDTTTSTWIKEDFAGLTIANYCDPDLSGKMSNSALSRILTSSSRGLYANSNKLVANQTLCPAELTNREFLALLHLRFGLYYNTKWADLLRELVSSNLAFSSPEVVMVVSRLVLVAGPAASCSLRATHAVLLESAFCITMLIRIESRIEAMATNWREGRSMECMVLILCRIYTLTSTPTVKSQARRLLLRARSYTHKWAIALRLERARAEDAHTVQLRSKDALLAALVCRQTFHIEAWTSCQNLSGDDLTCFLEAAITIKDSLSPVENSGTGRFAGEFRNLLLSDARLLSLLWDKITIAVNMYPDSISQAVNNVWLQGQETRLPFYTDWQFVPGVFHGWMYSHANDEHGEAPRSVHLDILEGTLLIQGQTRGHLPDEYTKENFFRECFGTRAFLTYPSNLKGMSYMLAVPVQGQRIHFGIRRGTRIMRVCDRQGNVLERIPPSLFLGRSEHDASDIPLCLIEGHSFWLNIRSQKLHIRPMVSQWECRPGDWTLDVRKKQASNGTAYLVESRSRTFARVTQLIAPFENNRLIIVSQPHSENLTVQLPALDLLFQVNKDGLLESRQLKSVIDTNQNAGTLYGLASKLVLRKVDSPKERKVIIPLGKTSTFKHLGHVIVKIQHVGNYVLFDLNQTLGRLESAPEPIIVYFKALCHALTSFVLPDPLTGRTGTEEALRFLEAGISSPWTKLVPLAQETLTEIASIAPRREFYPPHLKVMQRVIWSDELSFLAQDDRFIHVVANIISQSNKLAGLESSQSADLGSADVGYIEDHLGARAIARNQQYSFDIGLQVSNLSDRLYTPRDFQWDRASHNSYESAHLVRQWSPAVDVCRNIAAALQVNYDIKGFVQAYCPTTLSATMGLSVLDHWCSLFLYCRSSSTTRKFELMFFFALVSFGETDMGLIRTLIAISVMPSFESLVVPGWLSYSRFRPHEIPNPPSIEQAGHDNERFQDDTIPPGLSQNARRRRRRAIEARKLEVAKSCREFARLVNNQWPCDTPTFTEEMQPLNEFIDVAATLDKIAFNWKRLYKNHQLSTFLTHCQIPLTGCHGDQVARVEKSRIKSTWPVLVAKNLKPNLIDLVHRASWQSIEAAYFHSIATSSSGEALENEHSGLSISGAPTSSSERQGEGTEHHQVEFKSEMDELQTIIDQFTDGNDASRYRYSSDLQKSLLALHTTSIQHHDHVENIEDYLRRTEDIGTRCNMLFSAIKSCLTQKFAWLDAGGLLPSITPVTIFEALSRITDGHIPTEASDVLVHYAKTFIQWQHHLRVESAWNKRDKTQLNVELGNGGQTLWQPSDDINWLLLEIDHNIIIRGDQRQVASAMIAPATGRNSLLQMNMGRGKSSVIIPMIALSLANKQNLVRIVVPRPLLLQTAQLLQSRLGGLIGRTVKHVPFSRRSSTDPNAISAYRKFHEDLVLIRGILVCVPENVLSFHLSGHQMIVDSRSEEARLMMDFQRWLEKRSRDVFDECDDMLAVKTQLVYPSGAQKVVDGHPLRWMVVQDLLKLLVPPVFHLQHHMRESIEIVDHGKGTFPTIYLLNEGVTKTLLSSLTEGLLNGAGGILPVDDFNSMDAMFAKSMLGDTNLTSDLLTCYPRNETRDTLLLLRGLLQYGLVTAALGKRFNVQYGIHPHRDPIVVPFESKGVPSERAEYGHPDMSIILTCLSFYYGGLTKSQFNQSLNILLRSPEPAQEFSRWVEAGIVLPHSLRTWNSINIDDEVQCDQLWKLLRCQMTTINFYLNKFVFPRFAKTFEKKIACSGWDLATPNSFRYDSHITDPTNEKNLSQAVEAPNVSSNPHVVGFSGTNDNRILLPLNVEQNDLEHLAHTNAEVLTYLLQTRNRRYIAAADKSGKRLTEDALLKLFKRHGIRMMIDAGAQILEYSNSALASAWLEIDKEAEAAVFFDEKGRAMVRPRGANDIPLAASSYFNNLASCIIYLDEAHTRGTDLKLPSDTVAALTLGARQTKDHTVQAAMRLRQLSTTQSVVFFAPPEVHQSILNFRQVKRYKQSKDIDSGDVIMWLIEQTCQNVDRLQPLYLSQGVDYCRRITSLHTNKHMHSDRLQRDAFRRVLTQHEKLSLEDLYGPKRYTHATDPDSIQSPPEILDYVQTLTQMRSQHSESAKDAGHLALADEEVEQEREVEVEVETVTQIQRPKPPEALPTSKLHKDIAYFARTGELVEGSSQDRQAFSSLKDSTIVKGYSFSEGILSIPISVSADFEDVIRENPTAPRKDQYRRDVKWLLWSMEWEVALIVSDSEAHQLIPIMRNNKPPRTHLIMYSAPINKAMRVFDTLKLYAEPPLPESWTAPEWLVRGLGLFAGRLYFDYETEYPGICGALGLPLPDDHPHKDMRYDGQPMCASATTFMTAWLGMRSKGQDFSQTPMGEVCRGRRLMKATHGS